jgi:hypothetical protein
VYKQSKEKRNSVIWFRSKSHAGKVNPKKGSNLDLDESPSRLLHSRRR